MRLGAFLDLDPESLEIRHLHLVGRLLEEEGFDLPIRRRKISAYLRFLDFIRSRKELELVGPKVLDRARNLRPQDRVLLSLNYLAGFRLSEIAHLEGRDVRLKKGTLVTRLGYRIVPLHPALKALFLELRDQLALAPYRPILTGVTGYPLNSRTLHARFQRLALRIGRPDLRPDTLRREASAYLTRLGAPPGLVRAFLGKDRGRPMAPRQGRMLDLLCLADRLARLPA
jgi:integrase